VKPPSAALHPLTGDPVYAQLKAHIIAATGLAYYADKDADLAARIAQRLARLGLSSCSLYLALLEHLTQGTAELDALIADLTIGETFFFRHRELFDALRTTVLPDLIGRNRGARQLRFWSAGCATGAEPYSLAILLRRDFGPQLAGWDVTIVGTDINRDFLARAWEGRFEEWAFRSTPEEIKRTCFTRSGDSWLIDPVYKEGITFQYHNLVAHPFPSLCNNLCAFDLILCRNVMIYFSPDVIRPIIERFGHCLVADGWLLVGHAEPNQELFRSFRTVNAPGAVLYQRSGPGTWGPMVEGGSSSCDAPSAHSVAPSSILNPSSLTTRPPAMVHKDDAPLAAIRTLADRGAWDEAAACCEDALARDRLNATAHFYQGLVFEQTGRHVAAEQALRRAIYLDRGFTLAHYYLGLLLQKLGQDPAAIRSFRNVLQLLTCAAPEHRFAEGDGITAVELNKLTRMHLEVLEK
jgi:chemotaxis protein methyltransferase CheR